MCGLQMEAERGVLQVVIVDSSQSLWRERDKSKIHFSGHGGHHLKTTPSSLLSYDDLIRVLLLFCNAHSSMSRDNLLCLLAYGEDASCESIFPSSDLVRLHSEKAYLPLLTSFCEEVTEHLLSLYNSPSVAHNSRDSVPGSLSNSLSRALCSEWPLSFSVNLTLHSHQPQTPS
jgi:hypothetical protein